MTQEDKELLLKDLCSRLPYRPIAQWNHKALNKFRDVKIMKVSTYGKNIDDYHINVLCQPEPGVDYEASIVDIKPYLQPMQPGMAGASVDWLNRNMFDYRGLIPMGLAIAITEENNPYK